MQQTVETPRPRVLLQQRETGAGREHNNYYSFRLLLLFVHKKTSLGVYVCVCVVGDGRNCGGAPRGNFGSEVQDAPFTGVTTAFAAGSPRGCGFTEYNASRVRRGGFIQV